MHDVPEGIPVAQFHGRAVVDQQRRQTGNEGLHGKVRVQPDTQRAQSENANARRAFEKRKHRLGHLLGAVGPTARGGEDLRGRGHGIARHGGVGQVASDGGRGRGSSRPRAAPGRSDRGDGRGWKQKGEGQVVEEEKEKGGGDQAPWPCVVLPPPALDDAGWRHPPWWGCGGAWSVEGGGMVCVVVGRSCL